LKLPLGLASDPFASPGNPFAQFRFSRLPTKMSMDEGRAMTQNDPEWISNGGLAAGKGATIQEFAASVGRCRLVIDVSPWGEGHLRVDDREVAHIDGATSRYQAFVQLKRIARRYLMQHRQGHDHA
jgi:hypothetical protein